jgi:hypothetical protein
MVALIAAKLGKVRLIDNMLLEPEAVLSDTTESLGRLKA